MKEFLAENSKVNLISKNDENFLWEKHVCDSLAISEFFDKDKINEMLDNHYNNIERNGKKIYTIYTFLIWYERFFITEK